MKTAVLILLFLTLCLTACGTERVVLKPEIVEIVTVEYRAVPADLVKPIPKQSIPVGATYGDLIGVLGEERKTVDKLNGKLAGISSLGDDDDGDSSID